MNRPGVHFFEEFLIETKGAKTMGKLPEGLNNYPAPSLGQSVRKSGGYQINVATLGYNEQAWWSFLQGIFNRNERCQDHGQTAAGPKNYPAASLGPIKGVAKGN